MIFRILSAAVVASVFGVASVQAQSVRQVGGPANLPPSSFDGQQWVDSRGCVFLKAGYGGQTTWVPRVGRDRKAMCGYPPTGSTRGAIEVATAEEMAKPAAPVVAEAPIKAAPVKAAKPAPTQFTSVTPMIPVAPKVKPDAALPVMQVQRPLYTAPAPVLAPIPAPVVMAAPRQPAPYVEIAPRGGYETAASTGPSQGQIGCYTSAPVAERVKTRNGGTAVVCTRGDGSMTGWRPPIYPRSAGVGAALTDPVVASQSAVRQVTVRQGGVSHGASGEVYARAPQTDAIPAPPKGYVMAWEDGRLNPNRGKGTASGWAQQDQVWTRKVPSKLVADEPAVKRKKKIIYVQSGSNVTVSTKAQPATAPVQKKVAKAAKGGAYIQIGTFGVVSNADGAAARLKGIGLPVARAKISSGGKPMQIVMAGPFGSAADAQTALSMARQAGFGDAFIR